MGLHEAVAVHAGPVVLPVDLLIPEPAASVVVLASDRSAGRHQLDTLSAAAVVEAEGHGLALVDLLTAAEEEREPARADDVALLTDRLVAVFDRLAVHERTSGLALGVLALGTAAPAALRASVRSPGRVGALVCFDGRLELAEEALSELDAPTLLVVGGGDPERVASHRDVLRRLVVPAALELLPDADAPDLAEHLGRVAAQWFGAYLQRSSP